MKLPYLALLLCVCATTLFAGLDVHVGCTSAVLINSKTGKVLYEKNAHQSMYPASCTKIAFALYALTFHEPLFKRRISATQNALKTVTEAQKSKNNFSAFPSYVLEKDASHMGLKVGEELSFYDLLEATMVVSADDASNMIAEVMGNGSIETCVEDVNRYMHSLGLRSTRFMNPHGLHHPEHVTTAHDLAKLSQEAMKHPVFRKMAKMPRFIRPQTNKQPSVPLQATNRLLVKGTSAYYAPAIGIKTGYHRRAGYCLVAEAEKDGRSLLAVVLQGKNRDERFSDTVKLFQAAFNEKMVTKTYLTAGFQSFTNQLEGAEGPVNTFTRDPIAHSFYPSEEPTVNCQLIWKEVSLPLKKGEPVGELHFLANGQLIQKTALFAASDVKETFWHALTTRYMLWIVLGMVSVLALMYWLFFKKQSAGRR